MTIDLYQMTGSPPCRAVVMTLKHLDIEFNDKQINVLNGEQLTPEYLKLNPAHTIPTIVDDGFALWESRAIMQYLCNKYAPDSDLYPNDPKDRARVDRMLNFDMTLTSAMRDGLYMKVFRGIEPTEAQVKSFKDNLKLFDTLIGNNRYVATNTVTIADLSLAASVSGLFLTDYDVTDYPNVKEWWERLKNELSYFEDLNGEKLKALMQGFIEKLRTSAYLSGAK